MNKCRAFIIVVIFAALSLFVSNVSHAQISNSVSTVNFGTSVEGQPLSVNVELLPVSNLSSIQIAYRLFEEREFKIREMEMVGSSATYTIPAEDVRLPYITYYLIISFSDGTSETYPLGVPNRASPLEQTVKGASPKDQEVIILSPGAAETVALEELFVSISLIRASDNVDILATKVFIKGVDITEYVLFAGDLILFYANNFPDIVTPGMNNLKVELYDKEGNLYHTVESSFETRRKDMLIRTVKEFAYSGMVNAEARREEFSGTDRWYNNLAVDFDGNYKDWNFGAYAYVTSEEADTLQTQNRFSATVNYDSWFRLKAGDSYPRYSEIVMNGKRIRGINGSLNFGTFNIQSSYGEIYRGVEGDLVQPYTTEEAPLESNVIPINPDKHDGFTYGLVDPGTYKRNLFVVRPSFGSGRTFQWGLTYLHGKDEPTSIEYGAKPKENTLAGTDLKFALDNQRIVFNGHAAVSLFNTDISPGELTDAQIDSMYSDDNSAIGGDADDFKNLRDQVGRFITFNQFIGPLNPEELSSLAAEASMQFNYYNNNLRASYKYRGNDYYSFGNDYLRTDLKGFNISDRIRLARNQVFITLSYEQLEDNLQETKVATTEFKTINTSVSYFPREDLPAITLGYSNYRNDNGIPSTDPVNNYLAINDNTNRFIATLSYDIKTGIDHATSLNITSSNRDDMTQNNRDQKYLTTSLSVNSYWQRNLRSTVYLMYYNSELPGSDQYTYFSLSIGAQYKMLEDRLNLSLSVSPSFGDFERQAVDFVGQYLLMQNLRLILQLRYYRTKNQLPDDGMTPNYLSHYNNSIAGLTVRYTL